MVSVKTELKKEYQTQKQVDETLKSQAKKPGIFALYSIEWEEIEPGWGQRPDGFSFHRSEEEATEYIKKQQADFPPERGMDFSRPCYDRAKLLQVSESLHDFVMENGSVWLIPKHASDYKTYDASQMKKPKKKM